MKQDFKTKLISRKIRKPNPVLMQIGFWVLGMMNRKYRVEFHSDYDPEALNGQPVILLSSHAARLEFIYSIYGFGRKDINVVCGYQNILRKGLYPLFLELGVISKYLYQPDLMCVKNMLQVLKRKGTIGLFPEGIESSSGGMQPLNPATAKFIKKSKANVVVCTTKGAYLATSRYSSDRKTGPVRVEYSLLFTPEQLETLTEEQIYSKMLESLYYNDFTYNKTARNRYVGKEPNAAGIDNILYKCPSCKQDFHLQVEGAAVVCKHCGFRAVVNEYYDLVDEEGKEYPFTIDSWYQWQRRCIAAEVKEDTFALELTGSLCTLRTDRLRKAPKDKLVLSQGKASLTNKGLSFTGTLDGKPSEYTFPASGVYSLTFTAKNFLEFYYDNDCFMIVPDRPVKGLNKWTLASEEIHNRYDEKWRAACEDVYDYSSGDLELHSETLQQ